MIYRAIGVMSGSSLDGLDIAFCEFQQNFRRWSYEIRQTACMPYPGDWTNRLKNATSLSAKEYLLLHADYGHYIGQQINKFVEENGLQYQAALIASHGHTTFHLPAKKMTAQLGEGSAIAAQTQLPVITDLRSLDVAFGGQGAPIVPIGEKLLLGDYHYFLNIGGIANISFNTDQYIAFDICPANRVLNLLANDLGREFDKDGELAGSGSVKVELLGKLNALDYYKQPFPKSLANEFGTETVYPLVKNSGVDLQDVLRTYVEHIVFQIKHAISNSLLATPNSRLLATGGGAFNTFMIERLSQELRQMQIEVIVPDDNLVKYKEAMIMAFIGVLRWRQENNVFASVTGASRDSIGGALWIGQEA